MNVNLSNIVHLKYKSHCGNFSQSIYARPSSHPERRSPIDLWLCWRDVELLAAGSVGPFAWCAVSMLASKSPPSLHHKPPPSSLPPAEEKQRLEGLHPLEQNGSFLVGGKQASHWRNEPKLNPSRTSIDSHDLREWRAPQSPFLFSTACRTALSCLAVWASRTWASVERLLPPASSATPYSVGPLDSSEDRGLS